MHLHMRICKCITIRSLLMSNAGNGYDIQAGAGKLLFPNRAYNPALGVCNPAPSGLAPQFGAGIGSEFN